MLAANLNSQKKIFLLMLIQKGDIMYFCMIQEWTAVAFISGINGGTCEKFWNLGLQNTSSKKKKKKILTHELIEMAFQHCWWASFTSTVLPASFTFLTKLSEKGRFFSYFPCRVKCLFSPTVLICKTNSFIESRRQLSCCWKKGLKA